MFDIYSIYSIPEVISFLENRNFENFGFTDDHAYIIVSSLEEFIIEAPDNKVSNENTELAIKVLKELEKCVELANKWLDDFNLKNDEWYPDALDEGFEVSGIYVGKYGYGPSYRLSLTDGFTITFSTKNSYSCEFTVKFNKNMRPFAVEEWLIY